MVLQPQWQKGTGVARKIALASTGPLSGKTTLAKHLEQKYGFIVASHSLSVVRSYVQEWNSHNDTPPLTIEQVYKNKERHRRALQQHGDKVGFNDPKKALYWIEQTLSEWMQYPDSDVVFDSIRGDRQAEVIRKLGFTLVELRMPGEERCRRAQALGRDCEAVKHAMRMRPDLEEGISNPDIALLSVLPVEALARILIDEVDRRGARRAAHVR